MSANETRVRTPSRHPAAWAWRRSLASVGLALALSPVLPVSLAIQDLPSEAKLQAALSKPLKTLSALADTSDFIEEAGAATADRTTAIYVRDAFGHIPADRGGRVGPTRLDPVQPRFAAGRLVNPANLLRAGIALGDAEMRTSLAGSRPMGGRVLVSQNFRTPGMDASFAGAAATPVDVASLESADVGGGTPVSRENSDGRSLSTLAAFAAVEPPKTPSLFDAVLGRKSGAFVPPIGARDHSWAASMLPASAFTQKEQTCLATGIYFEARGESERGQAAVAQVILNRVRNPTYPDTICGVVYQNQNWKNRCQFSFACDGIKDKIWSKRAYGVAKKIASDVTQGETWLPEVGSATHYHATYVHPRWAKSMEKVDKIGLHIFYRTFNGGWN